MNVLLKYIHIQLYFNDKNIVENNIMLLLKIDLHGKLCRKNVV